MQYFPTLSSVYGLLVKLNIRMYTLSAPPPVKFNRATTYCLFGAILKGEKVT